MPPSLLIFCMLFIAECASQGNIGNYTIPEIGKDYPGNDISINGAIRVNAATAVACAAECDKVPNNQCVGFVYWKTRFFGNIYGQIGVEIPAGSCYPKSSMKSSTVISGGDVYAYKSILRHSGSIRLSPSSSLFLLGILIISAINLY